MKSYCKGLVVTKAYVTDAYNHWVYSQAGKKNIWRVAKEHGSADKLINEIFHEIETRTLRFDPIICEDRKEGVSQKVRHIGIESVKQQVVEHIVIIAINDFYTAKLGHYQCVGEKGRGQLYASKAIRKWVSKEPRSYYVKADIRKCYESTSHEVIRAFYKKYVKSPDILYCIDCLLDTFDRGLNLGGFFSLVTMNLLLSQAYHYLERLGTERRGKHMPLIDHQLWFMDDILLIGSRKASVKSAARKLAAFLQATLGLSLKPWKVSLVATEPIDMVGFVHRPDCTTLRSKIFIHARRAIVRFARKPSIRLARRVCSYWGYLINANCWRWIKDHRAHHVLRLAAKMLSIQDRSQVCTS